MRRFKCLVAMMLVLSFLIMPATSVNAAEKSTAKTNVSASGFDFIELEERTVLNGQTIIWNGGNIDGFFLPGGTNVFFQVNAPQDSYVVLEVYRKTSNGIFEQITRVPTTITAGGGVSITLDNGYLSQTGWYLFGLQSYNLSPRTFTGFVGVTY